MAWGEETTKLHLGWQGRKRQDHSEIHVTGLRGTTTVTERWGINNTGLYSRCALQNQLLGDAEDWCSLYPGQAAGKFALKKEQKDKTHPTILQFVL